MERWFPRLSSFQAGALATAALVALALIACGDEGEDAFPTAAVTPAPTPAPSERVTFETADGVALVGDLWPADGSSVVVFAHMRGANRTAWAPAVERVLERRFAALSFDFRGHGESGDREADLGKIDLDLEAAVAFARSRGYARVFVVGASMGGTAALALAAREDLAGVAVLSSPASFEGIDAAAAVGSVQEPALFVAANGDQPYRREVEELHAAAPGEKRLVLVPGNAHGTNLLGDARVSRQVLDALVAFLGVP